MLIATTSQHEILQLFTGDDYFNLVISGFLLILCSRLRVHPVRFFGCSFVYLFAKIDISFCFVGSDGGIRLIDLRFSLWPENLMRKMKTSSKKCDLKHAHAFVHQLVDKTNDNKLASVFFRIYFIYVHIYTHMYPNRVVLMPFFFQLKMNGNGHRQPYSTWLAIYRFHLFTTGSLFSANILT